MTRPKITPRPAGEGMYRNDREALLTSGTHTGADGPLSAIISIQDINTEDYGNPPVRIEVYRLDPGVTLTGTGDHDYGKALSMVTGVLVSLYRDDPDATFEDYLTSVAATVKRRHGIEV